MSKYTRRRRGGFQYRKRGSRSSTRGQTIISSKNKRSRTKRKSLSIGKKRYKKTRS
jgi:hypothetical protein